MSSSSLSTGTRSLLLSDPSGGRALAPDQREHLRGLLLEQPGRPGLDVQAEERLGVRRSNVEPPVLELHREAVQAVLVPVGERPRDLLDLPSLVLHLRVDLARGVVPAERLE